jgi:hypothetical protein
VVLLSHPHKLYFNLHKTLSTSKWDHQKRVARRPHMISQPHAFSPFLMGPHPLSPADMDTLATILIAARRRKIGFFGDPQATKFQKMDNFFPNLLDNAFCCSSECCNSSVVPPLFQVSMFVKLATCNHNVVIRFRLSL